MSAATQPTTSQGATGTRRLLLTPATADDIEDAFIVTLRSAGLVRSVAQLQRGRGGRHEGRVRCQKSPTRVFRRGFAGMNVYCCFVADRIAVTSAASESISAVIISL